ncbi:tetratricopeptide repeat protein, partial [Streptomyces sp. NPDC002685]|uniref:tetratricopeptide repeat protein n=1 Tax=Streptomyces sp. NPDC002685 TaxID=3154540 RepID=UPI00331E0E3A
MLSVGVFTSEQSLAYLRHALNRPDGARHRDVDADLSMLSEALGNLPIALAQAAAYLVDTCIPLSAYLEAIQNREITLPQMLPPTSGLPDAQTRTVNAVWDISIDRADAQASVALARPILALLSVLDPDGIPAELLTTNPALTWLAVKHPKWRFWQRAHEVTEWDIYEVLRRLDRLSLIDHAAAGPHPQVRVHQLVQRAIREETPRASIAVLLHAVADALVAVWPELENDQDHARRLRANARRVIERAESEGSNWLWRFLGGHSLLFAFGNSLGNAGAAAAARDYFDALNGSAVRYFGENYTGSFQARYYSAYWRGQAGDPAGSVEAFEMLLENRLVTIKKLSPFVLSVRHELANSTGNAGDPAAALEAFQKLLPDRLRALGADHLNTLATRHSLAYWLGEAGDCAGAAEAFDKLLSDHLRLLGPDHPTTLYTRHQLAYFRGRATHVIGTSGPSREESRQSYCGQDRPDTPTAGHEFPLRQNDTEEAFQELLADQERVLGPDHSETMTTRHTLAVWRGESGDATGAVAGFEELLPDRIRTLGPDHPHTLNARYELAAWRGKSGDIVGAVAGFEELLPDRIRTLGPDHPDTLTTRHALAVWRGESGDAAAAVAGFEELLPDRIQILGPDHPHTMSTRYELAYWRGESGDAAGAVAGFEELLPDRARVLGPDHP